jgi:hypothetical protein
LFWSIISIPPVNPEYSSRKIFINLKKTFCFLYYYNFLLPKKYSKTSLIWTPLGLFKSVHYREVFTIERCISSQNRSIGSESVQNNEGEGEGEGGNFWPQLGHSRIITLKIFIPNMNNLNITTSAVANKLLIKLIMAESEINIISKKKNLMI